MKWLRDRKLKKEMSKTSEAVLKELRINGAGAFARFEIDPEVALHACRAFGALLADAPNYMTFEMTNPTLHNVGDWVTVTIQRTNQKTPAQKNIELEAENKRLREKLEQHKITP